MADARSIFAILILAAGCGAVIDIEVNGADKAEAHAALTAIFDVSDDGGFDSTSESFEEDNLKS